MIETKENRKFYGKYRGTVLINVDPEFRGRITAIVPDVLGITPSSWCEACAPLAGPTGPPMGIYLVPPLGAGVWVEFENGDPNKPIWTGCRVAPSNVPVLALANPASPVINLQSLGQNSISISDLPVPPTPLTGGIVLRTLSGASIVVNDLGIFLDNGKGASITMIGPAIALNKTSLTIIG